MNKHLVCRHFAVSILAALLVCSCQQEEDIPSGIPPVEVDLGQPEEQPRDSAPLTLPDSLPTLPPGISRTPEPAMFNPAQDGASQPALPVQGQNLLPPLAKDWLKEPIKGVEVLFEPDAAAATTVMRVVPADPAPADYTENFYAVRADIPVWPGRIYELGATARSDNPDYLIEVVFFDKMGHLLSRQFVALNQGDGQWHTYQQRITAPAESRFLRFIAARHKHLKGSVEFKLPFAVLVPEGE